VSGFDLRPLTAERRGEYVRMLHASFNTWYAQRGWAGDYFKCAPEDTGVFLDVYEDLTPGTNVSAFHRETGRLIGTCFYHPRPHHMSLGIMAVHPDHFGRGVGTAMVREIIAAAEDRGTPVRLVSSAFNVDSFNLYGGAGFVPRECYADMVLRVPRGYDPEPVPGIERVREATAEDVPSMAKVERRVAGITRELDYRYVIRNARGIFHTLVVEDARAGELSGFSISVKHPAVKMIGPAVADTQEDMAALISRGLHAHAGAGVLLAVPMGARQLVELVHGWGGRTVETHLLQVRGEFPGVNGVSLPGFLPETG
jgi:GNAT superfamily N-acetyltransferase